MKIGCFCILLLCIMIFSTHQQAPMSYTLISNTSLTLTSNTYIQSESVYYVCTGQVLNAYDLLTGAFKYTVNFSTISTGSTLQCYDALDDDSFCLFNKGTTIIRFKGSTQTYDYYDNTLTKTKGRLLLDGTISVTNIPSMAKLYILDHTTNVSVLLYPDSGVTTADYSITVNITRQIFSVFQSRKIFTYHYVSSSWVLMTNLSLSPPIGSNVYFLSYSPSGDLVYHSKGTSTLNIRNSTNLALITTLTYTGLNVVNVQFMSNIGDSIYILLWNSTSGQYSGVIYNTTTALATENIILTTTLLSLKIYEQTLTEVITYSSYVEVWKLDCPVDSVYVSQYGNCFYCNQTNLCPVAVQNATNSTNITGSANFTNNLTYANSSTNTTNLTNATNTTYATNTTNSTVNSTTNVTTNVTTNITANATANSTINATANATNTTTNAATNLTSNSTSNYTNLTYTIQQSSVSFSPLEESFIDVSSRFYSFPTIRSSLKSFSYAFLAMDSLWMYCYHNRTYGGKVAQIFTAIQRVQNLKFAFLTIIQTFYKLLTNTQLTIQTISDYSLYTAYNFYDIEQNDGSFLSNCLDYLIYQIPFTILIFYIMRKIFYCLFNYQISKYIRLYEFWGYCLITILEPNIEYFFFLLTNQFRLSFYFSYKTKFLNVIWIFVMFFAVLLSTILVFLMKYLYENKTRLFMQGVFNKNMGFFWICFNTSIKRMCTGFIHSYFVLQPLSQITYLIIIEVTSIVVIMLFWKNTKIFKQSLFVCMNIIFSLGFVGFQGVLLVNSLVHFQDQITLDMMDTTIYVSVLSIFGVAFLFGFISLIPFQACKKQPQTNQNQQKKKNTTKETYKIVFSGTKNINKKLKSCINNKDLTEKNIGQDQKVKSSIALLGKSKNTELQIITKENPKQQNQQNGDSQMEMIGQRNENPKLSIVNIKNINVNNYKQSSKFTTLANERKIRTYKTKLVQPINQQKVQVSQRQSKSSVHLKQQPSQLTTSQKQERPKKTLKSIRFIQQIKQNPLKSQQAQAYQNIFVSTTNKSIQPSTHRIKSQKKIKDDSLFVAENQIQT